MNEYEIILQPPNENFTIKIDLPLNFQIKTLLKPFETTNIYHGETISITNIGEKDEL